MSRPKGFSERSESPFSWPYITEILMGQPQSEQERKEREEALDRAWKEIAEEERKEKERQEREQRGSK